MIVKGEPGDTGVDDREVVTVERATRINCKDCKHFTPRDGEVERLGFCDLEADSPYSLKCETKKQFAYSYDEGGGIYFRGDFGCKFWERKDEGKP